MPAMGDLAGGTFTPMGGDGVITLNKGAALTDVEIAATGFDPATAKYRDTATQIAAIPLRTGVMDGEDEVLIPADSLIVATDNTNTVKEVVDFEAGTFYFELENLDGDYEKYNGMRIYRHKDTMKAANNAEDNTDVALNDKLFTLNVVDALNPVGAKDPSPATQKTPAVPAMTSLVAEPSSLKQIALSGSVASVSYALTAGTGDAQGWSFGTKYDAGVVTVGLGMNSNSVLSASVGGSVTNIGYEFIYVRQSGMTREAPDEDEGDMGFVGVNNWNALGLKVSSDLGSDSDVAVKYSKLTDKNGNDTGAMNATQIEVDFNYGLGGGASFFMEYDRVSETMGAMPDESSNTIQAGIKMSF